MVEPDLRALSDRATPGPWEVQDGCSWRRIGTTGQRQNDGAVLCPTNDGDGHPNLTARDGLLSDNLEYIVALVNAHREGHLIESKGECICGKCGLRHGSREPLEEPKF